MEASSPGSRGLGWLVEQLHLQDGVLSESVVRNLLLEANLPSSELAPYIEHREESYARRCVARNEHFELLVLTWAPTQYGVAHDHSGSLCGLKVVDGRLTETLFADGPDGRVRLTSETSHGPGDILTDPGTVVHALANASADEPLITVHVYSPPLPEVRRYAVTEEDPPEMFLRPPAPEAQTVAIIGGGFTGTMVLANLIRQAASASRPMHFVLIDRQPAPGDGVAYRAVDGRHVLNVPAGRMSAWPDLPEDFLHYAQSKNPAIGAHDFLPRKMYGEYVRECLFKLARSAGRHLSASIVHDEAKQLQRASSSGWKIDTAGARTLPADVVVLAVGHRPPKDPLIHRWTGPRTRFIADPWASLALSLIRPDEPVLLMGSGLTAMDVVLTLQRSHRTAPLLAISRRGLLPSAHLRAPKPAIELPKNVAALLHAEEPLMTRELLHEVRCSVQSAIAQGFAWQQVIDSLRPAISHLWTRLDSRERARFLRHARSFWETHRHRMAPEVADTIQQMRLEKKLEVMAGTLLRAEADDHGIDVSFSCRGGSSTRKVRVAWVINCTGPDAHSRHATHSFLGPLLQDGTLVGDELGLGLWTDEGGRTINIHGETHEDLLVAGTLRKATLWESTAVPELRQQAQTSAQIALATLASTLPRSTCPPPGSAVS
ncbi:FAD/NAD(P)-binding protein [Silvibacterium dinghuense]|nr:FAD/NAD(P)-binding protein [Silvibacterium dinghuense]